MRCATAYLNLNLNLNLNPNHEENTKCFANNFPQF
jgi:hypothetical protein